jgi:hypothetical protein
MRQINQSAAAVFAILVLGFVCATSDRASAQPASPGELAVSLVRQDFSDCTNGNVSDSNPSLIGGTLWIVRRSNGMTGVKVAMTAQPNTTYHFFLKCVRLLGDIKTEDEGLGTAVFEFATSSAGNVYAFDMYPEGAPAGNKFQSVQVKFQ